MMRAMALFVMILFGLSGSVAAEPIKSQGFDLDNFVYLDTEFGRAVIVLYPKKAPNHVERVRKLVREGFYDGLKFHRVIHGFMAQTGDPTGTGTGGSPYEDLRAEFNDIPFNRGAVGAARTQNPHSANSQFFICFQAAHHLNGQYTVWGKVVYGMKYIDKIRRGRGPSGMVDKPDKIVSMKMASDEGAGKPPVPLQQFVPGYEQAPRQKVLPRF